MRSTSDDDSIGNGRKVHSMQRFMHRRELLSALSTKHSGRAAGHLNKERAKAKAKGAGDTQDPNKVLAKRLLQLLQGRRTLFRQLQAQTRLFRAGKVTAVDLERSFVRLVEDEKQAHAILSELAGLLGSGPRQAELSDIINSNANGQPLAWTHADLSGKRFSGRLADLRGPSARTDMGSSKSRKQNSNPAKMESQTLLAAGKPTVKASKGQNVLLWLRTDLRLHDNPVLHAAARHAKRLNATIAFCFINSPEEDGEDCETGTSWRATGASLVWQQASLESLDEDLKKKYGQGAAIIFRQGPYAEALQSIVEALNIGAVYYAKRHEPAAHKADLAVEAKLQNAGLEIHSLNMSLLHEPENVKLKIKGRGHFGTLSPFLRACKALPKPAKPLPIPSTLPLSKTARTKEAGGLHLTELGLIKLPHSSTGQPIRWDKKILDSWTISESAAIGALDEFISTGLQHYETSRYLAGAQAVSKLSPYIHSGQLSARLILSEILHHGGEAVSKTFQRRLIWRDLAYWQLYHWPQMSCKPIRTIYEGQEWRDDPEALTAWQKGMTGFPMVDAGMRQLWQTGWMQQSVRMICALFLTEYMNIHWVHGCRWFHICLVDADLAINSMMWQNAGKSGIDQWNFTLLPHSGTQDPDGAYVRKWVPELAKLPRRYIHQPWQAPSQARTEAGVSLGSTYPHRITGHQSPEELRKQNKTAICKLRMNLSKDWIDDIGYDLLEVPQGSTNDTDISKIRVFTRRDYRIATSQ